MINTNTLQILDYIMDNAPTTAKLTQWFDLSERQVKRCIAEAREMGAQLDSVRATDGVTGYYWVCSNSEEIIESGLLGLWLDLVNNNRIV